MFNKKGLLLALSTSLLLIGCNIGVPSSSSSFSSSSISPSSSQTSSTSGSSSSIPSKKYDVEKYYGGYYKSIQSWNNGADLIKQLNTVIRKDKNNLRYDSYGWEPNQYADQALDDFETLDVVYSSKNILKEQTQTGWQREHAFCASLMTSQTTGEAVKNLGRATDFHNLFAVDQSANSSRSNKNLGVADKNSEYYQKNENYSFDNRNFEPSDYDKGRLARATFYIALMYNFASETETTSSGSNPITYGPAKVREEYATLDTTASNPHYTGNLSTLVNWCNTYNVDRLEYQHNQSVYSHIHSKHGIAQNNRNPFVDYPSLVDYCFGSKQNESGRLEYIEPSYELLNISSTDHANYAILTAPRTYDRYSSFDYKDIKIVDVKKDFSTSEYNGEFTCNIANGYSLKELGDKDVIINIDGQQIKYNIYVKDTRVDDCAYKFNLGGQKSLFNVSKGSEKINLGGVDWNVTYGNTNASITSVTTPASLKFGASTDGKKMNTLVFESDKTFAYNSKNKVKSVYVKANIGSGTTCTMKMYVNDVCQYMVDIPYTKVGTDASYNTFGIKIAVATVGKVKIEFSNIISALSISDIAVDVIS